MNDLKRTYVLRTGFRGQVIKHVGQSNSPRSNLYKGKCGTTGSAWAELGVTPAGKRGECQMENREGKYRKG